jgi:hypothetical protein
MADRQIYQLSGNTNPFTTDLVPVQNTSGATEAMKVALSDLPLSNAALTALAGKIDETSFTQTGTTFNIGWAVYKDNTGVWQRSNASSSGATSTVDGVIISFTGNTFVLGVPNQKFSTAGLNLTTGTTYYLATTTSGITYTSTAPSAVGQVYRELFRTNTANEATVIDGDSYTIVSAALTTDMFAATGGTSGQVTDFLRRDNTWVDPTGVMGDLRPYRTYRTKQENVALTAFSATTILNVSGTGQIMNFWWTGPNQSADTRLQIFVDGEVKPSVNVDLLTMCLGNFGTSSSFMWDVQHVHGEGGYIGSSGGWFNYPVPFSNGCVVKISTVASVNIYTMVDYVTGMTTPYRLKSIARSLANDPVIFATGDSLDLFQTPSGSPGWFIYLGYAASGSGDTHLERNFELYVDNEGTASNVSSGTEDFFFGSYYWQGKTTISSPNAALAYKGTGVAATAVDLLQVNRGIYFTDNLRLRLPTEANVAVGHNAGFIGLFYTPSTSTWATPVLTLAAPDKPTNVVATAGNASASLTWIPPAFDGGSTITGYTVTSSPTGFTSNTNGTTISTTVTGLTNNSAYTFTVVAKNNIGTSVASTASNSVTPTNSSGSTYLFDTFTDSDSATSISAGSHSPDTIWSGSTYSVQGEFGGGGGAWGISSNKAYQSTNSNGITNFCYVDAGHTDGTVTCDITTSATTDRTVRGIVFRYSAYNNHIRLMLVKVAGTNQFELKTTSTTLALDSSITIADNTTYAVKIVMNGNNIKVYINNTLIIDNSDSGNSSYTGTNIGMAVYSSGSGNDDLNGRWDNLKMTS